MYLYLVAATILFNFWIIILIHALILFFGSHQEYDAFFHYGGIISGGLCVFLGCLFGVIFKDGWGINFMRLLGIRVIQGLAVMIIILVFNYKPFEKINESFHRYYLIDDETEAGEYEDDLGNSHTEYVSSFRYFTPIVNDLEGLVLSEGEIQYSRKHGYYIDEGYELISLNIKSAFFWQYAKNLGYYELEDGNYLTGGFISNIFKVGPFFVLELVLTNLGSSLILVLLVIIISLKRKEYFFKDSDQERWDKRAKEMELRKEAEKAEMKKQAKIELMKAWEDFNKQDDAGL